MRQHPSSVGQFSSRSTLPPTPNGPSSPSQFHSQNEKKVKLKISESRNNYISWRSIPSSLLRFSWFAALLSLSRSTSAQKPNHQKRMHRLAFVLRRQRTRPTAGRFTFGLDQISVGGGLASSFCESPRPTVRDFSLSTASQRSVVARSPRYSHDIRRSELRFSTSSESSEGSPPASAPVLKHPSTMSPTNVDVNMGTKIDTENVTLYEYWVRRLYMTNIFHPVKMGLDNMLQLHKLLGNPMDDPNRVVVHIAGTNGKGSVALKIANTLQNHGLKVGLFCSPHVSSFRERMQVNGELISTQDVETLLPHIYNLCAENDIPATFFEITTALAFAYYQKENTQVVVLETGLGGRLDATNVVAAPAISVITSIGLEHTRILGDTVELIAKEKGGIIKKSRPVLVGPNVPHHVLRECAEEKGASSYYTLQDVLRDEEMFTDEAGGDVVDYDVENSNISKAAIRLLQSSHPDLMKGLTDDDIASGTSIRPPCRFEEVERDGLTVILDVAHNPPAMEYLVQKLRKTYPDSKFRFVVGMSSDKDLSQCGQSILSLTDPESVHLVEAAHPRAAKVEAILEAEPLLKSCHCDLEDRSITHQVEKSMALSRQNDELLVVCGSVFLMAEAREALGFDEPRDSDYIAEVAGAGVRHGQENFGNSKPSSKDSA